ncbi:MAG TPA: copper chaperone PCu(A)C [Pseudonocardiaceae bacterium]
MRVPLNGMARILTCCAAALAVAGCSAGQVTQTDSQVSAVDGAYGNAGIGGSIALRNVVIPYPRNPQGNYAAGSTVPVLLTIVNQGTDPDELISVSSPVAGQVMLIGTTQIPAGTTLTSTAAGSTTGTSQPASPLDVGELRVLLTTNQPVRAGLNTPITFEFRNAGKLTLPVPMATPSDSAS